MHDAVQNSTAFAVPKTEMSSFAIASLFDSITIGDWKAKANSRTTEPKILQRMSGNLTCMD